MNYFHLHLRNISRGKAVRVIRSSAYISGQRLYDAYFGERYDFSFREDVLYANLLLPQNSPAEFEDRTSFWNAVELSEKRADARTAREITVALPKELSLEQHIDIIKNFVADNFISKGLGCDIAIHDKGDGNPHAHILINTREITSIGFSPIKNRELNKTHQLIIWRASYADLLNRSMERHDIQSRVSHESNFMRGIETDPTYHLGKRANRLERLGVQTYAGNKNREIVERGISPSMEYTRHR